MQNVRRQNDKRPQAYLLISLIVLASATAVAWSRQIIGLELSIFRAINDLPNGLLLLFLILTQAGSAWMLFGLTLLLVGLDRGRLALRIFCTGALTFVLSELLKNIVARPRPGLLLDATSVRERALLDYGFPSGHTAVATVMALVMYTALPRKWRWLAWAWIVVVALSRIYLGVHAPLDVVGGFALGVSVVCVSLLVRGKLRFVTKITGLRLSRRG